MKEKNKNPLYVVKGDEVQPADGVVDLLVKKLNLEPLIDIFMNLFKMLFESVNSYSGFLVIKNLFDEFVKKMELFRKFAII